MSGHSKWSTIKHKKAAADNRRGQLFTKLGRAVTIAAREGGPDPESNFKLRLAVDKAREANMPKVNIDRAIEKGSGQGDGGNLETVVYEGFGPGQAAVIIEAVTDNKNRTAAEIKKIFERGGGSLGQPGSAAYLFHKKGRLMLEKQADEESQMLRLIDLGADEIESGEAGIEVLVPPASLSRMRADLAAAGFRVSAAELIFKAVSLTELKPEPEQKLTEWLDELENLDDVQAVYTNW